MGWQRVAAELVIEGDLIALGFDGETVKGLTSKGSLLTSAKS